MDRIREARRTTMAANNGLTRRRHRTNTLRDSPEEDGSMDLQEPTRLRDRGSGKKDRDRERERERDRMGRTKRRRGDRLMHSGRDDGGDDTSDDSINDDEDDDGDDGGVGGSGGGGGVGGSSGASVRMVPLNPSSLSSSSSSLNHHRKSFPTAKVFRPAPPTTWKAADEMIGVSVPRKARSASTKRSHECWASSSTITVEQNHRQASTSPVRTAATVAAPASPSSSNASARKKIKSNGGGPKFRPPKSSSKSSSSAAQEEIEIEIAEVLYGMMRQPQGPSKQEIMALDPRDGGNKVSSDAKSMISSPISNSQSIAPQNSSSSAAPISAFAPKRKKPRPVKPEDENPAIFGVRSSPISTKAESDQPSKMETCSSNSEKNNAGSAPENLANPQSVVGSSPETIEPEGNVSSESRPLAEEPERQKNDVLLSSSKEVVVPPQSPKKESPSVQQVDDDREDMKATKVNPTISESENQREEKFQIDLMAPPPQLRSSPERAVEINLAVDSEKEVKPAMKPNDKSVRVNKEEVLTVEKDKVMAMGEETESHKAISVQKERGIDLHLDLEKSEKGDTSGNGSISVINKKQPQPLQRQQQQQSSNSEKNVLFNSLPLPGPRWPVQSNSEINVKFNSLPLPGPRWPVQSNSEKNVKFNSLPLPGPSWSGGLPHMGYMTPLQGVVSMDGTTVTSAAAIPPPQLLFNQPRPKRCATHCYIARNIAYHQQIARMNPFWPAAAGSASLYGAKPGHLNIVPPTDLHANVPGRGSNSTQDKGHSLAMFPGHIGKEKASQPATVDNSSRKQILLQQALPPGAAPSNILHGPAFIFPLNQQQAAAAASVRPGSVKSLPVSSNGASSCTSISVPPNASVTGPASAAATTMSFSYPSMPGNETQYLAILQNNAYPFPIPAHVGSPPAYRGSHAQAFPFYNGSFYSSQMLHPSQIQQQQQQLPVQSQQNQQGHQNTSISSGSSSSQKHAQNQQQKPNTASAANGSVGGVGGSLQGFPVTKNQASQPLQLQQQQPRQQLQNHHHAPHPARQNESDAGGEDSPSIARATMNIYSQSFGMPMQTPNFALMTPASISGAGSTGAHGEKKQPQQHPGSKAGGDASQAFAMSFASINGTTAAPGLDLSSIAQNHSLLQHHNYQIMAAAQAANAQNKNYHVSEEVTTAGNSSNHDEDRKSMPGKIQASVGQSIAFSRADVSDPTLAGNNAIDSSGCSPNLGSASSRATASVMPAVMNTNKAASSQQQMQRNQQQILQLQKQNQFGAAVTASARNKMPSTSNGIVYSDNLPSTSSMATKFPNAVSAFPQSLVQSSSTVAQSAQWKNSVRPTSSQTPQSMASTPPSSVKSLPQQQARLQQPYTQISFAANPKSSTSQVQPSSSNQSPSPVMVGSPTTSLVSKNTGSPRTTSASANNKISQTTSLSAQQAKISSAAPARKSSPIGGRNVPSIHSGPQLTPSSSTGSKSQMLQQQQQQQKQQQQIPKQTIPQAQLFFSNPYMHSQVQQSSSSTSTTSATASGYHLQRRGPEQMQRLGTSSASSNGAAVNSTKGLVHPAQFATIPPSGSHHQFVPAGFPYVHPVPTAVQVKPSDQKQPAGE